jgi:hypothetical protein
MSNWTRMWEHAALVLALVAVLAYAHIATAQSPGASARPAQTEDQKRKLIEQKIALVENLLNAPAAKQAERGADADARALFMKAQQALEGGKTALRESRFDDAGGSADQALRMASALSRRLSSGGSALSDSALRKNMEDLAEQLAAYRRSLVDLSREGRSKAAAAGLLSNLDASSEEARKLAAAGRIADAGRKLAEAYRLTVDGLARLRAGEEVVLTLKLETPADEFNYEHRRFLSNETIAGMMVREGRAGGDRAKLVETFLSAGRALKADAEALARGGNHREAIPLMERANTQLNRALQAMGVPAF